MPVDPLVASESIAHQRIGLAEHARYRERRQCCSACLSCREVGVVTTICRDATPSCQVGLIDGDCPRGKWQSLNDQTDFEHGTSSNQVSSSQCRDLFVYGFPGLYAGANTELHHQIILWRLMGLRVNLIPGGAKYQDEVLYPEMIGRGVIVHQPNQFDAIIPGAPVLGFCNDQFLIRIDEIRKYSHNTVFVNCMTWLFEQEKHCHRQGKIAAFLYQNDDVLQASGAALREINSDPEVQYLPVRSYIDTQQFPFIGVEDRDCQRQGGAFTIGRISRDAADKYTADTLQVWEAIQAPGPKRGVMLGFGPVAEKKIGKPPRWIDLYGNQQQLSQQNFYRRADVLVQPMDTTETGPRVGLEAMASGTVVIADNRGGWRRMVEHGVTGWLCDSPDDFIRYATQMAHEPQQRAEIARAARDRLDDVAGFEVCSAGWGTALAQLGMTVPERPRAAVLQEYGEVGRAE